MRLWLRLGENFVVTGDPTLPVDVALEDGRDPMVREMS